MGIANYNTTGKIFDVDLEKMEQVEIDKLYESQPNAEYTVNAILFSNKGMYGKAALVCFNGKCSMWLPKHQLEECEKIVEDSSVVEQIKEGKAGFKIVTYKVKEGQNSKDKKGNSFAVEWIDYVG